jgi:hypothetical protein
LEVEFEIVEAVPGRRIVWRARDPRFDWDVALDLDPIGESRTQAAYRASIQLHGRWRLASPLVAMEGRAGVGRELRKLKDHVEGPGSAVRAEAGA